MPETARWSEIARDWSEATKAELAEYHRTHSVALSPDNRWLMSNGQPMLVAWDLAMATKPPLRPDGPPDPARSIVLTRDSRPPFFLAFSQDGSRLAESNGLCSVTPGQNGGYRFSLETNLTFGGGSIIGISPDAKHVATSGYEYRVISALATASVGSGPSAPGFITVRSRRKPGVALKQSWTAGSVFPAHANTGDPNGPLEACPLMRSHTR